MKGTERSKIIRLIICAAILALVIPVGIFTDLINLNGFSDIKITAVKILKLIIMILGVLSAEAVISLIVSAPKLEKHRARSLRSIISSLLSYAAFLLIVCWGLSILGVNVSTIVASMGILALVIGFSAESLISDMVTGTFMIFENQYNVGDIVEIDGFRGTVSSIGIRTTCVTDMGGNVKIYNNSAIKNLLNRSDNPSRSVSDIAVPYETDLEKLESRIPELMQKIYENHSDTMKNPPVYLGVQELADSSVVLRFVVEVDEQNIYSGARILNHDLLLGFRSLGVECPFPQVDVHTK